MKISRNWGPDQFGHLVVNGRFLTRPATGVDRVAHGILSGLAQLKDEGTEGIVRSLRILTPAGACAATTPSGDPVASPCGRLSGQAWEQLELPFHIGDAWLLNLCNLGPVATRRSVVMIHDAQVYLAPDAYTRAFRSWYKTVLPILGRRARIVTTVSNFSRDALEAYGVVPRGKAEVIPNGADHITQIAADSQGLQRFGLSRGRYFLAVGSLSPHKNLETLIAAAGLRRDRSVPLVIAGGAAPRIFADAGMPETADSRYLGRVSDAELKALYQGAMALAFPSLVEGFGLPPLEAMVCGCPVIASNTSSIPEVCGRAALYVDPLDVDGWARLMDRMASDPALGARLGEAGRAHALRYTWRNAALSLLRLIALADGDANAIAAIDRLRASDGGGRQPSRPPDRKSAACGLVVAGAAAHGVPASGSYSVRQP